MSIPRRQHYVPVFYLSRFSEDGKRDGKLNVFDLSKGIFRPSRASNEAHQRDFYTIENPPDDFDPFLLESEFSKIEAGAADAIHSIAKSLTLPHIDSEEMGYLLSFIGLLSARTPRPRKIVANFMENLSKMIMKITFATKERFELTKARMRKEGKPFPDDMTYEKMSSFLKRNNYSVEVDQNWHLGMMLEQARITTDCLTLRNWSLGVVTEGADLITGDHPVALHWTKPQRGIHSSPGFMMPDTEVTLPLSPNLVLIGRFDSVPNLELSRAAVALVNGKTMSYCRRFMYCPTNDFIWYKEKRILSSGDFLNEWNS